MSIHLISLAFIAAETGLSETNILDRERAGTFPQQALLTIKTLEPNWDALEVEEWKKTQALRQDYLDSFDDKINMQLVIRHLLGLRLEGVVDIKFVDLQDGIKLNWTELKSTLHNLEMMGKVTLYVSHNEVIESVRITPELAKESITMVS